MEVTVLGCGSSGGVPMPGLGWGACDPDDSRNHRTRPSLLISQAGFNLLVDTGPDLHQQLTRADVKHIDAIFYTHEHADHTHGIDDIRGYLLKYRQPIPAYADAKTAENLRNRFGYIFTADPETDNTTHARKNGLDLRIIEPHGETQIGPFLVKHFQQSHGHGTSLGLRINDFAYSTDASYLSRAAFAALAGVSTWIVDCNNRTANDSFKHSTFEQTLGWIDKVGAARNYLTHLPGWFDYKELAARCPDGVEPAYDGLKVKIAL